MAMDGYITDVDELYAFSRSINWFGDEFQKGCLSVMQATELDYSLAHNQVERLKGRVTTFREILAECERDYDDYMSNTEIEHDSARESALRERIQHAQADVKRAEADLSEGENLFIQIRTKLTGIRESAHHYAYQLNSLCDNATRAINSAADLIERQYMS